MYVKSAMALSSCMASAHAWMRPVYVTVVRSMPSASISRKSSSAFSPLAERAHAEIAVLYEIVVGIICMWRISSKVLSAPRGSSRASAAAIAVLCVTTFVGRLSTRIRAKICIAFLGARLTHAAISRL